MNLLLDKKFKTETEDGFRVVRSIPVQEKVDDLKSYYSGYEQALDDVMQILELNHRVRESVLFKLNNIDY